MNNEEIKKKALKLINERHGALGFEPMILTLDIDEVTYLMTEFATQLLSQPTQGEGELRQLFRNNSDCYADTWEFDKKTGKHIEGEVTQAMTEDRFIKVLNSQHPKAECEGDWNSCKHIKTCGHHPCNLDECPEFEPDLQIEISEPQTPAELRAEFQHLKMKLNYACYDKDVLSKMGAVWEAMDKLEQKITTTNKRK